MSTAPTAAPVDDVSHPRRRNRPLAAWRKARAVELAIAGRTYEQIAAEVGYANRGTAYKVVQKALRSRTVAAVDELRSLEVDRLDALQASLWPDAMAGDVPAVSACAKIVTQRCRLLGLFEPVGGGQPIEAPLSIVVQPKH